MLYDIRVIVEEVMGKCTSGLKPGDHFILRSGRLYIPKDRHFCLYALHAALPLLPAKQRHLEDDDWMKEDWHVICPDPAGNVIMRIERMGHHEGT
ncbi:MAG: TIGR04076 family protein [Anaerolineae bacterium]